MALVEMGRMRNRYRLSRSQLAQRARLDRIADDMVEGGLEQALHSSPVPLAGELCIRRLDVSVRVRLSRSDAVIVAAWSRAITASIRAAVEQGNGAVVMYGSRGHVVLDMAASVARGDTARAWAWTQLGMWHPSRGTTAADAVEELVRLLEDEPVEVVHVLTELARRQRLGQLAARLSIYHLERLAMAAAQAGGGKLTHPVVVAGQAGAPASAEAPGRTATVSDTHTSLLAAGLAARSAIFRELAGSPLVRASAEASRWAAVLVALEADPGVVVHGGALAAGLVDAIGAMLASPGSGGALTSANPASGISPQASAKALADITREEARLVASARAAGQEPATSPMTREGVPGITQPKDASQPPVVNSRMDPAREGMANGAGGDTAPPAAHGTEVSGPSESPPADPRRQAVTAAGGLLFLIHLVERLGLPERLVTQPEFAGRSLRWSLHRLALLITGVAGDDPAALAFCGLSPDSVPPSREETPPVEAESAALESIRDELALMLADTLDRPLEPPADVMAAVWARPAVVVAELGWIDIVLSLDDVSTEIRRAGLDLNPGWVPWLGVVLRFVYA